MRNLKWRADARCDRTLPGKSIAIYNYKGGVAKTTITRELAATMAKMGYRVGIIDCDPQCNLTTFFLGSAEQAALLAEQGQNEGHSDKPSCSGTPPPNPAQASDDGQADAETDYEELLLAEPFEVEAGPNNHVLQARQCFGAGPNDITCPICCCI